MRGDVAFEINRDVLGLRPTDQRCHHEVWIHHSHANAPVVDQYRTRNSVRREQDHREGKKRNIPHDYRRVRRVKSMRLAMCSAALVRAFVALLSQTCFVKFGHTPSSTHRTHVTRGPRTSACLSGARLFSKFSSTT